MLVCLAFWSRVSLAYVTPPVPVEYDDSGFPRCISAGPGDGLLLLWDETNHYSRAIYGLSLRAPQFEALHRTFYFEGCTQWRTYAAAAQADLMWTALYPEIPTWATSARLLEGEYAIPREALIRLADARRGASSYLSGATARDILARRPIGDFTRAVNRQLTATYGVGIAADIYKEWLLQQPRNRAMRDRVRAAIARAAKSWDDPRLRSYVFLIAQGFLQTDKQNRLKSFFEALNELGIEHRTLPYDPLGSLETNAARFETSLAQEFRSASRPGAKRVVAVGASKGAPELMLALARLQLREPALIRPLAATITLAGMYEGSYLVDWAGQGFQRFFVSGAIGDASVDAGLVLTDLDGFYAMSTPSLVRAAATYSRNLPDVPYFDFVGVIGGDGLARDAEIAKLQTKLAIPRVPAHGANDGYIEYPGTMFPRSWNRNSTEIIFDSSHAIVDGYYDGRDMSNVDQRRATFAGIFRALIDSVEGRFGP